MVLCEEVSRMLYSIVSRPVEQTPLWMFRHSPMLRRDMDNKARQLCRQSAFNLATFPEAEKKSKREKSGSSMKVAQSLKSIFHFLNPGILDAALLTELLSGLTELLSPRRFPTCGHIIRSVLLMSLSIFGLLEIAL